MVWSKSTSRYVIRAVYEHKRTRSGPKVKRKVTARQKNLETFRQICLAGASFRTIQMCSFLDCRQKWILVSLWLLSRGQWVLVSLLSVIVLPLVHSETSVWSRSGTYVELPVDHWLLFYDFLQLNPIQSVNLLISPTASSKRFRTRIHSSCTQTGKTYFPRLLSVNRRS